MQRFIMDHRIVGIVLAGSILFVAAGAHAATYQAGLKAGVAVQTLDGEGVDRFQAENRTGFAGGAYFQGDLSRNFGVRVEALYYMKGATGDSAGVDVTIKLDYVEFPVLLMAHIPVSDTARLSVFGGPTFSFNTKSEVEASFGGLSGTADIGDAVTSFDFGLAFGAGVSFDVGRAILGFDGRYGFGLDTVIDSDFVADEGLTFDEDDEIKNQGFAFMAQLGFPIGGAE